MTEDEQAIRKVVETWMRASQTGDAATVLSLMTEDAVFTVPGREPFGREVFEAAAGAANAAQIDGTNEIVELQVLGDWAFTRNRIDLTITPPAGEPIRSQRLHPDPIPEGRRRSLASGARRQPFDGEKLGRETSANGMVRRCSCPTGE